MLGKREWFIADAYWESQSLGAFPSHEAVCVLNTGEKDAQLRLTLYFEDREPLTGFTAACAARRCNHIRMDRLLNAEGQAVPLDAPYAIALQSDEPVVVQYSRMMTAQSELALMTTMAYGG